ncbi:Nif3-like dinuclear metal center hexameric protein [Flavobacteriaceae bacterium TP-CH-4]|uniref:GTP cyclohydrolase 1 type 2 homolog n=1 Tax=Pelagihabitans pacificus TaxID=2696054 RepID=A0A967AX77_9FLAO|nr:Nif3-like dinuclear metal center hexameric protein [Pelagihabitans pacificus]NHF60790.1 Nif3-like dinuclear metal center hexameric protein [Pelagihabitans pacificus]
MTVKEVTLLVEELAPLGHAEDFDNVGLLVGDYDTVVSGILVTLDTLENVVDEAIANDCNLIISFHPIIFGGLERLNGNTYVERVVIKAIQHNICIYSMHTALDNAPRGVNARICEVLGIQNPQILIPKKRTLKKLTTYVPNTEAEKLRGALFEAGAGHIGNYSHCSFSMEGIGSYRAGAGAQPTKGEIGKTHFEQEQCVNVIFPVTREARVLNALFQNHPYEEVAYEVLTLENTDQTVGMGMIGRLEKPIDPRKFLESVRDRMNAQGIRHSRLLDKKIQKVAVLGGSGAFAIGAAKKAGADMLITSDLKYHQYYEAEDKIVIADIGHYETEQFTKNLLVDYLTKKMPNFAIRLSESKTNPINYL